MRKIHDNCLEFLASEGYAPTFPKEHARILFNTKLGEIQDLIVEDFSSPEKKQYLYSDYNSDFGNCLSDWCDWSFSDVLIKIFVSYTASAVIRIKILFELSRVEEWRPHLAFWIHRNCRKLC